MAGREINEVDFVLISHWNCVNEVRNDDGIRSHLDGLPGLAKGLNPWVAKGNTNHTEQ